MPDYDAIAKQASDIGITYIDSHKDEWVSEHGFLVRKVAIAIVDRVETHIPTMAERTLGYVGHTLGIMPLNDIFDALMQMRAKSSWQPPQGVTYRYTSLR